ncbi:hypothetical protein C8P63_11038 [Melghirimyces profundicolus]|uniref:Lipoprotein n=1 Tax=Melghirimyces profundicolus TaxID=1242148 RepID=A0A2T6BV04_9BACL|nr:hypothetical protein [Melghirimyces profundicolus]PTX59894.1 hypothetical protein C8P63_11038 [Melghirimyces profundicolus]
MSRWKKVAVFLTGLLLLAGCVRTEEFNRQVSEKLPEEVQEVQTAVDLYRAENNDVLPLKPPQGPTLYQKYIVDFSKLEPYLGSVPSNSFQKGGNFVFVVVDPGKKPKVKVMDLRVTEKLRELQGRVNVYREEHGNPPTGKKEGEGLYALDFEKLKTDPVTIPSPYHSQLSLPLLVDRKGVVHVDYRMDVVRMMEESGKEPGKGEDLRRLLVRDSLIVPAYSPRMELKKGDPVLKMEE